MCIWQKSLWATLNIVLIKTIEHVVWKFIQLYTCKLQEVENAKQIEN